MVNKMNIVPEITRKSITHLINNQERVDGRALDEYREISLETGVISKAEGSARVKIGNTQIMVGTKPQIGEPFPDTPDVGVLMTNSELLPMASPSFEPGPPDERSVELSRVADRCIRESEMVDLKELCIIPGKKVWMVFIDLHILDYDGNLMDAAVLGAVAALKNTMIPEVKVVDNEIIIDHENMKPLPIREEVVMCTFAKIGEQLVIDPSLDEEEILSARLSIGITASDKICAMQKGGDSPLTKEEIMNAVKITEGKSKELMKYLE
ncbi:exosome complex protein Rrp42 [Methanobacterium alkalithermotolerans]|uniref:Exosome complex component Rrp42 n=2 Tax=Methanobacterium alkalithermotolerans TaxID=2731220 RepID=A0A8T8K2Q5_9EURY|nr:exosome complex protein Rrp42 [Methanobacterium alkalithermotolerans]QUH22748.1 exosome complex protein Rrp42 [Methanobacterium alkalithermotolerans]RJS49304.1 MAG: RNA-binding protein [Methanobacterium sp.]